MSEQNEKAVVKPVLQEENRKKIKRIEAQFEVLRTVLAIGLAMALVLIIISFVAKNSLESIQTLLIGPLTNIRQLGNVVMLTIPLTFAGLALSVVFKSNRFNLAADSAFYFGAMIATIIGIVSPFPAFVTVILALLAGLFSGAVIGFIPAYLNKAFKTSELVISLMMNYIVSYFVTYLFINVYRDKNSAILSTLPLQEGVNLGLLFRLGKAKIHYGLIIVLVLIVLAYIVIYKTKWGYALRATGMNEKFARYVGLNTGLVIVLAQVVGTALAGLGGAVEMLGRYTTFRFDRSPGYGWDGVLIATLAKNNPKYVPLAAFFLAYIRIGADMINLTTDVPAEIIAFVQASVILLISAKSFLSKWKQKAIIRATMETIGGQS